MTTSPSRRLRPTRRRRLQSRLAAATPLLAALLPAACGVRTTEEQLLQRLFEASRVYDLAAVAKVSTVVVNPVQDGIVLDFDVVAVGAVKDGPGGLPRRTAAVDVQVRKADTTSQRRLTVTFERRGDHWMIVGLK